MKDSCNLSIKFNPYEIDELLYGNKKTGVVGQLYQKGAFDDRGSFYEMLSKPEDNQEVINNVIRLLKTIYNGKSYTDDKVAQEIIDCILEELKNKIKGFECDEEALLNEFEKEFKEVETEMSDNSEESFLGEDEIEASDLVMKAALSYYFGKTPGA